MKITSIDTNPFHQKKYISRFNRKVNLPYIRAYVNKLPIGIDALFATSDLQGWPNTASKKVLGEEVGESILALVRSLSINPLRIGILLCGDFCANHDSEHTEPDRTWASFAEKFKWVVGIAGNHDILGQNNVNNIKILDGTVIEIDTLKIGGIGGIVGPEEKQNRKSETNYVGLIEGVLAQSPDILLMHDGPDIPTKNLVGTQSLRRSLEKASAETLVIRGHKHWERPLAKLSDRVQVLNVHSSVLMLVSDNIKIAP